MVTREIKVIKEKQRSPGEYNNIYPTYIIKSGTNRDVFTGMMVDDSLKYTFMEKFDKIIFEKNGEVIELTSEQFFDSLKNQDIFIFMRPYLFEFPFCEDSWFSKCKR